MSTRPNRNTQFEEGNEPPVYQTIPFNPSTISNREYLVKRDDDGQMILVESRTIQVEQPLSQYSDTNPNLFEAHLMGIGRALVKQPQATAKSICAAIGIVCLSIIILVLLWRGITGNTQQAQQKPNSGESSIWFPIK